MLRARLGWMRQAKRTFSAAHQPKVDPQFMGPQGKFSLDKFFEHQEDASYELSKDQALRYMNMALELSKLQFNSEKEQLAFTSDFQAALLFAKKLDEIDVTGVEPLTNVLDFYGGNEEMMRSSEDFRVDNKNGDNLDFIQEFRKINKNMEGNLIKVPKPFKD